ncbi:MAG TPA: hypothetical protein VEJ86_13950 [Candidatus Binataceae bacterium]|nr:hypothetical protein [Candidatus Binataceae bacterium]
MAIGAGTVGATAYYFWWKSRHQYRCPHCGRFVVWKDVNCPHCGENMKGHHRDPGAITRVERDYRSQGRRRRDAR